MPGQSLKSMFASQQETLDRKMDGPYNVVVGEAFRDQYYKLFDSTHCAVIFD